MDAVDILTFKTRLQEIGDAFGKKVTDSTVSIYCRELGKLTEHQWIRLCEWAIQSQETFPKIATLRAGAFDLGFFHADVMRQQESPFVVVVCKCSVGFTVRKSELKPEAVFHCPGGMTEEPCPFSYDATYIQQNVKDDVVDLR